MPTTTAPHRSWFGLPVLLIASSLAIAACAERDAGVAAPNAWFGEDGAPGTVSDLTVEGVTATSVTLAFTEVDDGTGQPANYFVRYMESPMSSWGHATDVSQGSCQVPMAGTEIGAWRSCTVEGLAPSTTYDLQLVAFRGTLNQDAVFGELSNVVTATTEAGGTGGTGDLEVTTRTTGSDPDPDGYLVVIDWNIERGIGINNTIRIRGLAAGDHEVKLDGVAAHCTVSGGKRRTVTIPDGGVTSVTYDVNCGGVSPGTGDLAVTAATTGSDLDPDGYTVTIAGGGGTTSAAVATNGSVTFPAIPSGDYSVTLSGVAGNCTVSGANPRTVTVPAGGTGSTTFSVSCGGVTPGTGDLTVTAATTGSDLDPDGYTVTISGTAGTASQAVATIGSVTFAAIPSGDYSVTLSGVAANCTVGGANPRTVSVPPGGAGSTTFAVTCEGGPPPTGGRITGLGAIGPGPAAPGGDRQEFDFDVAATPAGRVFFRDWTVIRPDGSIGTLTVSPTDGATSITAFRDGSARCADPTRGVEFDGIGRVNTGGDSNPAGDELLLFTVTACDNGPAGSGADFIRIDLPAHSYFKEGLLTSGDVVKSAS